MGAGLKLEECGLQSSVSCRFSPGVRWQLEPRVGWGACYSRLSMVVQSTSHFSDGCLCAGTSSKQLWAHAVTAESWFPAASGKPGWFPKPAKEAQLPGAGPLG